MTEPESHQVHAQRLTAHIKPRAEQLPFPGSTPVLMWRVPCTHIATVHVRSLSLLGQKTFLNFDGRRRLVCAAMKSIRVNQT